MRLIPPLSIGLYAALANADMGKRAAIDDCLTGAGVPTDAPGSAAWKEDVAPFNQRVPYTPVAIVVPSAVAHVQAAVSCAAKVGVKVNAKSGGHSYASFGLGGENGHLVVELDRLNAVTVDLTTKIATIQAGARLGHVATSLYSQGKRAISHGTCPGVGLAGHSLHGGFGFSSHTHGLALDWMAGATVVLANSTVVNCSLTENSDLFWALRGAGSSFGVVTSFKFNTFEAPSVVTVFSATLPWNNAQQAATGWTALQDWVTNTMPAEMNMRVFGMNFGAQLQGLYYGPSSALQQAIAPLMTLLGTSLGQMQQTDYMGGFAAYDNGDQVDVSHPYNLQELFFSKSLVTTALPTSAMQAATSYWFSQARQVSRSWYIIIDMYGGKKAAIPKVPANLTSYAHRDKLFLYEFYDRQYAGAYPSNGFDFLNGWVKAFTDNLTPSQWGMYINYADPTMNQTEAQTNYYRDSLLKLQRVKAQVDPNQLFYYPQSIQPAK
ncbi:FAD-binding domain-containing protein [Coniochaeta hoffmannii]|uniref:FAD-binding domain-containing protein n=1 Tax=Coniochaeta hoffmannii TaxID=91930 RepID=A0AA38R1Y5_9PEZI|nr:FAD-binding domain-containing protein [Coniochaeta hoffmannii]